MTISHRTLHWNKRAPTRRIRGMNHLSRPLTERPARRSSAADNDPAPSMPEFQLGIARLHVMTYLFESHFKRLVGTTYGISLTDWRVLDTIALQPGVAANQISLEWGLDKMTVSRALQRLKKEGLVCKKANMEDRRKTSLALTAKGGRIHAAIKPIKFSMIHQIEALMDRSELRQFRETAETIIQYLRRLDQVSTRR